MTWDIFICFIYLNSLFEDSFYFAFHLYPLLVRVNKVTQTLFSFFMLIDIVLTFVTAFEKEMKIEFEEDEVRTHRHITRKLQPFNKVADTP